MKIVYFKSYYITSSITRSFYLTQQYQAFHGLDLCCSDLESYVRLTSKSWLSYWPNDARNGMDWTR